MFNTYSGTSQAIVHLAKNVILLRITQNDRQFFYITSQKPCTPPCQDVRQMLIML